MIISAAFDESFEVAKMETERCQHYRFDDGANLYCHLAELADAPELGKRDQRFKALLFVSEERAFAAQRSAFQSVD